MDSTFNLLLVDDQPDLAKRLIQACADRFLEAKVTVAGDAPAALAALERGLQPNAVILDIHLPAGNGFEVLKHLRSHPRWRSVPVIMFTIDDSDAARYTSERLGASYYQLKPVSRTGFAAFATFLQTGLANGAFDRPET